MRGALVVRPFAVLFACTHNAFAACAHAHVASARLVGSHARPPLVQGAPRQAVRATATPRATVAVTAGRAAQLQLSSAVLDGLDDDQRSAVLAPLDCVVRVSAGPGSGKTRVLTRRVQALAEQPSVQLRSVLALTFSKRAAGELRERLAELLGHERAAEMSASTFHLWCARALHVDLRLSGTEFEALAASRLRELHGLEPGAPLPPDAADAARRLDSQFSIADSDESRRVLKQVVPSLKKALAAAHPTIALDELDWSSAALLRMISLHKSRLTTPPSSADPLLPLLLAHYEEQLLMCNALDFNDLLHYMRRALVELPRAAQLAHARWAHVLVDEWQDTDGVMYAIIKELAAPLAAPAPATPAHATPTRSLFVVGDADQSIYQSRGAMASNLAALESDFAASFLSYALPNNYRSTEAITTVASAIIGRKGATRAARTPAAAAAMAARGAVGPPAADRQVLVVGTDNDDEQRRYVAGAIATITGLRGAPGTGAGGRCVPLSEVCVLGRTSRIVQSLEAAFIECKVPYVLVGGTAMFDRADVKDALAHVRLAIGAGELGALERAVTTPRRGLGKSTLALLSSWIEEVGAARAAKGERRLCPRDFLLALAPDAALAELAVVDSELDVAELRALRERSALAPGTITKLSKFGEVVARARARALGSAHLGDAIEAIVEESGMKQHLIDRVEVAVASAEAAQRIAAAAAATAAAAAAAAGTRVLDARAVSAPDGEDGVLAHAEDEQAALERVLSLGNLARADGRELTPHMDDVLTFLASVTLDSGASDGELVDAVRLMTLRRSKGLEFEVVFVTHCEEGTLPSGGWAGAPLDEAIMDEERRLMYVGATRAKSRLYFTWSKIRTVIGKKSGKGFAVSGEISRFLAQARVQLRSAPGAIAFKKVASARSAAGEQPARRPSAAASMREENAANRAKIKEFERRYG
ncbi:hypothetical protein KFE25_003446 [Diacronema lutheri]|uniref:DNA 3'-5' helicase n=3 Tax=Diacronema lutheri TaxID=2081491 RepID=A0A8J5XHN5_DIALT|nr:hypothetical protein KFE25_003446 [Diacronema lutheri]